MKVFYQSSGQSRTLKVQPSSVIASEYTSIIKLDFNVQYIMNLPNELLTDEFICNEIEVIDTF